MTKNRNRAKVYDSPQVITIQCSALPTIETGEGKKPTAEILAYTGDVMQLSNYKNPVIIDLDTLIIPDRSTPVLLNHDMNQSIGHSTDTKIEDYNLYISAALSAATDARRQVIDSAKEGFPWGASITVDRGRTKKVPRGAIVKVNGREFKGPVNVIYHSRLRETSLLPVGGDISAGASVHAQLGQGDENMTFDEFVAALDISLDGIVEEDLIKLQQAYNLLFATPAEDEDADPEADEDVEAKGDETAKAAEGDDDDEKKEEKKVSAAVSPTVITSLSNTQKKLEELRANAGTPPPIIVSTRPDRGRVIQAALCQRYGIPDSVLETDYTPDELTEASSPKYKGYGIKRAFVETLKAAGKSVDPYSFGPEQVRMAFKATAQASGFSTTNLDTLVGAVANKRLLQQFTIRESIAVKLMSVASASNYQLMTSVRPTMGGELEEVGTDGEIKHATMSEETYTNRAYIYAKMLQLAEQHIINDELGGFLQNADQLARMAWRHREKKFFALLLGGENSGYYSTSNTNSNLVASDKTQILSIDGLTEARTLFMKQVDSNKDPLDVQPTFLLVPEELVDDANVLVKSLTVNETTSSNVPSPVNNPHSGRYEVLASPWMNTSTVARGTAFAWWLFAAPNEIPTYEVVYLNGVSSPVVETDSAAFNQLGMQMRVVFRYGIGEADFRGGVKSDGVN